MDYTTQEDAHGALAPPRIGGQAVSDACIGDAGLEWSRAQHNSPRHCWTIVVKPSSLLYTPLRSVEVRGARSDRSTRVQSQGSSEDSGFRGCSADAPQVHEVNPAN